AERRRPASVSQPLIDHGAQRSTLFPYTTLSRSRRNLRNRHAQGRHAQPDGNPQQVNHAERKRAPVERSKTERRFNGESSVDNVRSEEHTSELQSRENRVCRLLLEKKT